MTQSNIETAVDIVARELIDDATGTWSEHLVLTVHPAKQQKTLISEICAFLNTQYGDYDLCFVVRKNGENVNMKKWVVDVDIWFQDLFRGVKAKTAREAKEMVANKVFNALAQYVNRADSSQFDVYEDVDCEDDDEDCVEEECKMEMRPCTCGVNRFPPRITTRWLKENRVDAPDKVPTATKVFSGVCPHCGKLSGWWETEAEARKYWNIFLTKDVLQTKIDALMELVFATEEFHHNQHRHGCAPQSVEDAYKNAKAKCRALGLEA